MRKIWAFFWYQNLQKFEKNLKQSDRAPLISREKLVEWWTSQLITEMLFLVLLDYKMSLQSLLQELLQVDQSPLLAKTIPMAWDEPTQYNLQGTQFLDFWPSMWTCIEANMLSTKLHSHKLDIRDAVLQ